LRHPSRAEVVGMHQCDEPRQLQARGRGPAHERRGLGGDALLPELLVDVPADLDLRDLLELERPNAAVAREARLGAQLDQPGPESARRVELAVEADPRGRLVPGLGPRVEAHLVVVGDHRGEDVEVVVAELAQPQAVARQHGGDVGARAQACSTWWAKRTARAPSPTAPETRLVAPARTSPAAKTPGRTVSSRWGRRSLARQRNGPSLAAASSP